MDTIFHEKQEGQLCAQHCLNALLQAPIYTAVDLATLGSELDEEERQRMTEGLVPGTAEYQRVVNQPSSNMDDTGFFSVQVISRAIAVWGLELVSFTSSHPRAVTAKFEPAAEDAFICNYREHWLTIRKLGSQWFNLNSLLSGPELISETYLGLFLTQLQNEGYTVYVVLGDLPPSEADDVLSLQRVTQDAPPPLLHEPQRQGARSRPMQPSTEDEELQRALAISLSQNSGIEGADDDLERALRLSEVDIAQNSVGFDVAGAFASGSSLSSEEDAIQQAIQLSLQSIAGPPDRGPPKVSSEVKAPKPTRQELPPSIPNPNPPARAMAQVAPVPPPAQKSPPTREPARVVPIQPATQPNPVDMAGIGNRVGGGDASRAIRQSTPDADEVRRRRLAFLEKMQSNPKN